MKTNILGLVVTLVVGIILAGSLLMPVLEDTTATEHTFTNVGRYYVSTEIDSETTITMNYDIDGTTRQWYIDDVLLEYEPTTTGPDYAQITTVVGSDDWVFRTDGRSRGQNSATGGADYIVTVTPNSIVSGTKTGSAPLMVASTSQTDYVLSNDLTNPRYLKGDSEIIACGYTSVTVSEAVDDTPAVSGDAVISFTGSIKDGFDISVYMGTYTFTVDNVVVNATAHAGYVDLYDFTSVEFDVISENDVATHCTYSVLAVPAEVTAELSEHLTPGQIALMGAIPVLVIVALLMAAVGAIALRRAD